MSCLFRNVKTVAYDVNYSRQERLLCFGTPLEAQRALYYRYVRPTYYSCWADVEAKRASRGMMRANGSGNTLKGLRFGPPVDQMDLLLG